MVFATARNPDRMAHLKDLGMITIQLDVTSPESVAKAAEIVRKATDGAGLDILINNAGITKMLPFLDTSLADLKQVLDTNLFGVFAVTHAFLPMLIQKSGTVANIGSIVEVICPRFHVAYCASKTALFSFSRILRVEVAPLGVKVVHVKTGGVKSKIIEKQSKILPDNSYYEPVRDVVEGSLTMNEDKMTEASVYAKNVADELLGNSKFVLWIGYMAWLARFLSFFSWAGILVCEDPWPIMLRLGRTTVLLTSIVSQDWLYMKQNWGQNLRGSMSKDKVA